MSLLRSGEGRERLCLVVLDVEYGVQLCNLQKVTGLFGEVEKFQLATLIPRGGKRADQFPDSCAIDVSNLTKIHQDLLVSLREQVFDGVAYDGTSFSKLNLPAQINDGYILNLP